MGFGRGVPALTASATSTSGAGKVVSVRVIAMLGIVVLLGLGL